MRSLGVGSFLAIVVLGGGFLFTQSLASQELPQFDPPLDTAKACNVREWVALVDGDSCPLVEGSWEGTPLFARTPSAARGRTFCRFRWVRGSAATSLANKPTGSGPNGQDILDLRRRRAKDHGLVPRCSVISSLALASEAPDDLTALSRETLGVEFLLQVGTTPFPFELRPTPNIRLALLDSHRSGTVAPYGDVSGVPAGTSGHGYTLAHLARALLCKGKGGDEICAAEIATQLALPLRLVDLADPLQGIMRSREGGHFGSPADLAIAIERELEAWRASATPTEHLVLNLSLGWDHELLTQGLGQVGPDGLNAEELAVQLMLEEAAAQGALVLAAVGNGSSTLRGSHAGSGPLLPAAWALGVPATNGFLPRSGAPLLWAVGGIDRQGGPLANARPKSAPVLAAYGDHAVARDHDGEFTEVLTGSSVATLVASSLAALVWQVRPELSPTGVMAILESSATPLDRSAEFYPQPSTPEMSTPPPIRRLMMSAALSGAWRPTRYRADTLPFLNQPTVSCAGAALVTLGHCGGDKVYLCDDSRLESPDGCPSRTYTRQQQSPWMGPQPGQNQCPSCSIDGGPPPANKRRDSPDSWRLSLSVPPSWKGCLTDLRIDIAAGGKWRPATVLANRQLCGGESLVIEDLPYPSDLAIGRAKLSFRLGDLHLAGEVPLYVGDKP